MTRRLSRQDAGNIVFAELANEPTLTEGCENTGLTPAQWHNGLAYIRDVLAEYNSEPIVFDSRTHRYALAVMEFEVDRYISKRVLNFLVQLRRLYDGSFVPAGAKFDTRLTARFRDLDKQITRLITDLDDVRKEVGTPESPTLKRRRKDRDKAGLPA